MVLIILAVCALVFSILAFCGAVYSIIQVEAMKNSTHQISYIDPTKQNFSDFTAETRAKLSTSNDPLETLL